MKKIFMSLIAMGAGLSLAAQPGVIDVRPATPEGKILNMQETILGGHLRPAGRGYQWRPADARGGNGSQLVYVDSKSLVGYTPADGKKVEIITLDEINAAAGTQFKGMPSVRWIDAENISFTNSGVYYKVNVSDKNLEYSFKMPAGAENFTPSSGDLFAFTKKNNLFYCDKNGNVFPVSRNKNGNIISGQTVSRNEFGITGGIFWSPDSKLLGFYRKDESRVSTFPLLDINSRTGKLKEIKYPMAGMPSENVRFGIYDIASQTTIFLKADDFGREQYLTNITWVPDGKHILVQVLNRDQKHMKLNMYDVRTGDFVKTILEETNEKFVEPQDPVVFLKSDPEKFIYRTDNRDGYRNLYICDLNGNVKKFTNVDADVQYAGQDAKNIYYTSAEVSPVDNHLFRQEIKSGKKAALTSVAGWHDVKLSPDGKYFIDTYSNLTTPRVIDLKSTDLKFDENLFTAPDPVKDYAYCEISLGTVKSADGKFDNYYRLIKPKDFDPSKKYPVVVYVYGGPHSQLVKNTWLGELRNWEMYMAQKGYLVYVQDNRGTSNRGAEFEKAIYGQCGQAEMADQMEGVKMLMSLPYVDKDRIGVHGWSYGGFMTISLITNYPDVFKVAVAGGPVIDWKWYEVMYGERYMDSPHRNAEGYEKVSLLNKAKDLKGKLLICQGAVDNVVVWQHSLSFIRACIVNNVQVDYFPYPCAEHNVLGKDRIHLMDKVTMYFEDYL